MKKKPAGNKLAKRLAEPPEVAGVQPGRLKGRAELIKAVTGWVQLIALIVLVVESILLYALYTSEPSDPARPYYVTGVLFFFVLVIVVLVFDRYLQREKGEQREFAVDKALDSVGKNLEARYGLTAERTSLRVEIVDLVGNTQITREWNGVSVSSDFYFPYLPGRVWVDEPGKITSPAKLLEYRLSKSNKKVRLAGVDSDGNQATFKFEIVGGLGSSDGQLDYSYESEVSQMFHMSKEELDQAYKESDFPYEFMAISLDAVVEELELEIVFPDGFLVAPSPAVFYGQSEIMHNRELARVQFSFNNQHARCLVKEPLLGLSYLVYWTPPPRGQIPGGSSGAK